VTEAYDRVVAAIPHLTPAERDRIVARLRALQSLAPSQSLVGASGSFPEEAAAPDAGAELLAAIADQVLRASGERVSLAALRRAPGFRAFARKAQELEAFAAGAGVRSRPARRALLAIGLDLLHRDLRAAGFSVSARTLMSCAHQVPGVLDKAFPGYARAGLLGMVVGEGLPHSRRAARREDS